MRQCCRVRFLRKINFKYNTQLQRSNNSLLPTLLLIRHPPGTELLPPRNTFLTDSCGEIAIQIMRRAIKAYIQASMCKPGHHKQQSELQYKRDYNKWAYD